jgi:hypothetical protein
MLLRIRIWIGIAMEFRIRIGIKTMPIYNTAFLGQRIITTTRSHGTGLIQDTLNLLEPTEETLHRQKTPFYSSVANPDPESFCGYGSGMNILDHISESLETIFWVKNS